MQTFLDAKNKKDLSAKLLEKINYFSIRQETITQQNSKTKTPHRFFIVRLNVNGQFNAMLRKIALSAKELELSARKRRISSLLNSDIDNVSIGELNSKKPTNQKNKITTDNSQIQRFDFDALRQTLMLRNVQFKIDDSAHSAIYQIFYEEIEDPIYGAQRGLTIKRKICKLIDATERVSHKIRFSYASPELITTLKKHLPTLQKFESNEILIFQHNSKESNNGWYKIAKKLKLSAKHNYVCFSFKIENNTWQHIVILRSSSLKDSNLSSQYISIIKDENSQTNLSACKWLCDEINHPIYGTTSGHSVLQWICQLFDITLSPKNDKKYNQCSWYWVPEEYHSSIGFKLDNDPNKAPVIVTDYLIRYDFSLSTLLYYLQRDLKLENIKQEVLKSRKHIQNGNEDRNRKYAKYYIFLKLLNGKLAQDDIKALKQKTSSSQLPNHIEDFLKNYGDNKTCSQDIETMTRYIFPKKYWPIKCQNRLSNVKLLPNCISCMIITDKKTLYQVQNQFAAKSGRTQVPFAQASIENGKKTILIFKENDYRIAFPEPNPQLPLDKETRTLLSQIRNKNRFSTIQSIEKFIAYLTLNSASYFSTAACKRVIPQSQSSSSKKFKFFEQGIDHKNLEFNSSKAFPQ